MADRKPLAFFESGGQFYSEQFQATDNIDMQTTGKIVNLADPTNAQDAATKAYVDAVATGLDWKESARVLADDTSGYTTAGAGVGATLTSPDNNVSNNTHDGVALALNDRVLVAQNGGNLTTPDADNGLYEVTQLADGTTNPLILTRVTDADQDAEVTAGLAVFVTEGTTYSDTGWVLITNDPITVDTTALQFSQFSSAVAKTYGAGLVDASNVINVELDTDADAQTQGADGGSSGLEFDVTGAAGQLRVAVDPAGGLERQDTGLGVLLNGTSLATSASGTLVQHSPQVRNTFVSNEALTQYHAVAMSTTADRVQQAQAQTDARAKVIGITLTTAGAAGVNVEIVQSGLVVGAISAATAGDIYYLQAAGGIGTTIPGAGNRVIQVGIAKNATDLDVQIIDYGKKAA